MYPTDTMFPDFLRRSAALSGSWGRAVDTGFSQKMVGEEPKVEIS